MSIGALPLTSNLSRIRSATLPSALWLGRFCGPVHIGLFPSQAALVLGGDGFSRTTRGFAPRMSPAPDPVKATEASLLAHGGLRFSLPKEGNGSATFSLSGGLAIEVREVELTGGGRTVQRAVAYTR